jgi:hypothetical protein
VIDLLTGGLKVGVVSATDAPPIDAARVTRGVAVYTEPKEAVVHRLLQAHYPEGHFEDVRTPGGERILFHLAVLSREQLIAPDGDSR